MSSRAHDPRDEVVQLIHVIQSTSKLSSWSAAVRAAPEAISVMAVCLRASSRPEAKAIQMRQSFVNLRGEKITFPSEFLGTNLQHCSDLGRAAFREAESGMRRLQLSLEDILGAHGTIRSIIKILDRPQSARFKLRAKMEGLQDSAKDCMKNAQAIKDKFDRLMSFVEALYKATQDKQGTTSLQEEENSQKTKDERRKILEYQKNLEILEELQDRQRDELTQAEAARKVAESEVDRANAAAIDSPAQISTTEIERLVRLSNPAVKEDIGVVGKVKKWGFGKSKDERREEKLDARERGEAINRQVLAQRQLQQKQIAENQAHALKALAEARKLVATRKADLEESTHQFEETRTKYFQASKTLLTAKDLLSQLADEKVDLAKATDIIKSSLTSLGRFKSQIDAMLSYFRENAEYVENLTKSNGPLGQAVSAIEDISQASGNQPKARVIKDLQIDAEDREDFMEHAMQLEGRFSLVYEIAGVYLEVSKRYIIPGINRLEELSILSDSEYRGKFLDFTQFCNDARIGIDAMSDNRKVKEIDGKVGVKLWDFAKKHKMIEASSQYPDEIEEADDD